MLIQRRLGASTVSTPDSSSSGTRESAARVRAPRRPNGLLGRLGMAETERVVGRKQHHALNSTRTPEFRHPVDYALRNAEAFATVAPHIAVRIKRGGGIGPVKPRQPSGRGSAGNGGNSSRLQETAWEMRWRLRAMSL